MNLSFKKVENLTFLKKTYANYTLPSPHEGSLGDIIRFCFDVYLEMFRMSSYIRREDVQLMARRISQKYCKQADMEEYNTNFVTTVMAAMDKDRDDRISYEEYRMSVLDDVARLQFLGQILPACSDAKQFTGMFSSRPFRYCLEAALVKRLAEPDAAAATAAASPAGGPFPTRRGTQSTVASGTSTDDDGSARGEAQGPGEDSGAELHRPKAVTSLLGRFPAGF